MSAVEPSPYAGPDARLALETADLVHDEPEVAAALDRLAVEITAQIGDRDPLILVVLHGGIVPASLLFLRLQFPFQVSYAHVTRYHDTTDAGAIQWIASPAAPVAGRIVLVVDDILDEGKTLAAIVQQLEDSGAAEVLTAVLVNKRHDRKVGRPAHFIGLEVPDRYVFGCGMDYRGYWRNLPAIYALAE